MGKIIQNVEELSRLINGLECKNIKIVMVNGCFDLFHAGHLSLLKFAKNQGDILIVAMNSDYSIGKLKESLRPIIAQNDRIVILSSIIYVDYAIPFDEENPSNLINIIRPDIIIKEEEYRTKKISEMETIEQCGAKIIFYKRENDISTSEIINKIKRN